jgi:hypothetical protein
MVLAPVDGVGGCGCGLWREHPRVRQRSGMTLERTATVPLELAPGGPAAPYRGCRARWPHPGGRGRESPRRSQAPAPPAPWRPPDPQGPTARRRGCCAGWPRSDGRGQGSPRRSPVPARLRSGPSRSPRARSTSEVVALAGYGRVVGPRVASLTATARSNCALAPSRSPSSCSTRPRLSHQTITSGWSGPSAPSPIANARSECNLAPAWSLSSLSTRPSVSHRQPTSGWSGPSAASVIASACSAISLACRYWPRSRR